MKKKVGIGILSVIVAAGCTFGGIQAKKGIDNYVKKQAQEIVTQYKQIDRLWTKKNLEEAVAQHEQKDKQWTKKSFEEGMTEYEQRDRLWTKENLQEGINLYRQADRQWTKENYEETISQEQLLAAINSTYQIVNQSYYKIGEELQETPYPINGSSILLNGGYVLTAKHVVGKSESAPYQADYNVYKFFIYEEGIYSENKNKYELEKIIEGEKMDYALLKLKDDADLPYYSHGLNLPDKLETGMQSVVVGFPLSHDKNVRLGNVSQTKEPNFIKVVNIAEHGKDYITFKNNIIPGDSGGPIFVVEDGNLKLTSLSIATMVYGRTGIPANINFGIKISNVVEDLENKLKSGNLDEKTVKEIENFLKLNKK